MNLAAFRLLICIVPALFMGLAGGQACTCRAPSNTAEAFEKSSAVFTGRVTQIYRSFLDTLGVTRTGTHRVKFEITKRWKGSPSKSVVVVTRLTGEACGFPFQEKKEYLVYVAAGLSDIETGICTGTKNIAEAELEMKQLDQLLKESLQRRK